MLAAVIFSEWIGRIFTKVQLTMSADWRRRCFSRGGMVAMLCSVGELFAFWILSFELSL